MYQREMLVADALSHARSRHGDLVSDFEFSTNGVFRVFMPWKKTVEIFPVTSRKEWFDGQSNRPHYAIRALSSSHHFALFVHVKDTLVSVYRKILKQLRRYWRGHQAEQLFLSGCRAAQRKDKKLVADFYKTSDRVDRFEGADVCVGFCVQRTRIVWVSFDVKSSPFGFRAEMERRRKDPKRHKGVRVFFFQPGMLTNSRAATMFAAEHILRIGRELQDRADIQGGRKGGNAQYRLRCR